MKGRYWLLLFSSAAALGITSVSLLETSRDSDELKALFKRPALIPYPKSNPFTEEKYELGKLLFFDKRLSRSNVMSCATCHNPSLSWSDGLAKGVGFQHQILPRRTPTLINAAWTTAFFWDGRARTLEEQALMPIESPKEMNLSISELERKLASIPEYPKRFAAAFPEQSESTIITGKKIAMALATFERGIVSDVAPFDRWIEGDRNAISKSAQKGFALFSGKANCITCHTGWNFTNSSFADTGIAVNDVGRGGVHQNPWVQFAFKTPTLRNVSRRGPYMHDGSVKSLSEVIDVYNRGGNIRRKTSRLFLKPLNLSEAEKAHLLSFLESLTSQGDL